MFDKKHTEALDVLKESALSNSKVKDNVEQKLTEEKVAPNPYLSELSKIL
jgi:hypothetical protein